MMDQALSLKDVPVISADPFLSDYLTDPRALHEQLREAGPVVYLSHYGVWGMARYEQVNAALKNWNSFSSAAGVGLSNFQKEKPWRTPSLLLEADPPGHTLAREVVGPLLSPRALDALRETFEQEAQKIVEKMLAMGTFDGVMHLAEPYALKVFGDAVGLEEAGREHLLAYGELAFNAFGPRNQLLETSLANAQEVQQWIAEKCQRENLRPGGFGDQIWAVSETGKVPPEWAALLVRSLLTAGVDTTVNGIAAALFALATHPEQWQALREDTSLAAVAFEETIRWESPVQTFFRTTPREVEIADVVIPAGEKVLLFLGAANRDPRKWQEPDRFDIRRNATGHVGFGMGIHRCVGQTVARVEGEILLKALASRSTRLELAGLPRRKPNNTLLSWGSLPLAVASAR